jgi:hypothetical protein
MSHRLDLSGMQGKRKVYRTDVKHYNPQIVKQNTQNGSLPDRQMLKTTSHLDFDLLPTPGK